MQEIEQEISRLKRKVTKNNVEIGERLLKIRNVVEPELTQDEFSKKYKISPRTKISKLEIGKQMLTSEDILIYIEKMGVNSNWLLTGKGKRFLDGKDLSDIVSDKGIRYSLEEIESINKKLNRVSSDVAQNKKDIEELKK